MAPTGFKVATALLLGTALQVEQVSRQQETQSTAGESLAGDGVLMHKLWPIPTKPALFHFFFFLNLQVIAANNAIANEAR